ncbi:hypothetical protein B4168_1888 [Anoxybacillus flavithermus]|nr:hypothetical protein B4168_1888 [Anoxybacillus flavithermus]OAO85543.1 hypothetical protein GT23_2446 [Parageobacillus thermoglucosidasius]
MVETIFKGEGMIFAAIQPLTEEICHKITMNIGTMSPIPVITKFLFH